MKICGITRVEDAVAAAEAGADAIGLNFVAGPRRIDLDRGREILRRLPLMVTPVALVRIEEGGLARPVAELLAAFRVAYVQPYGDVTRRSLAALAAEGFRPLPVVAVRDAGFADRRPDWMVTGGAHRPQAVVLDAFDPSRQGGTGRPFPWDWVASAREAGKLADWPDLVLAGGLCPGNVAEAVRVVRPRAVDVSSGVEVEGCPGRKDPARMRAFVAAARSAGALME